MAVNLLAGLVTDTGGFQFVELDSSPSGGGRLD